MKRSDAERLLDSLSMLEDSLLNEALLIDNKEKLKAAKVKNLSSVLKPTFLKVAIMFVIAAVVSVAIIINSLDDSVISINNGDININSHNYSSMEDESSSEKEGNKISSDLSSDDGKNNIEKNPHNDSKNSSEKAQSEQNSSYDDNNFEENESPKTDYSEVNIDSIDKLNYYTVKLALENGGVIPLSQGCGIKKPIVQNLSNKVCYEINKDTVFTVTRATYFTMVIDNDIGLLAKKLGGGGFVEVVITENSIDDIITFKRGETFYSCILDKRSKKDFGSFADERLFFSTNKYIDGFNVMENKEGGNFVIQVNYMHYVDYSEVRDLFCQFIYGEDYGPSPVWLDTVVLNSDSSYITEINESFTIREMEDYIAKKQGSSVE